MIDLDEINAEIMRLEYGNTTYSNCEKLSVLYAVRNGLQAVQEPGYSTASEPPGSEFVQAFQNAGAGAIYILDEHMQAVNLLYPKEYQKIIMLLKGQGAN